MSRPTEITTYKDTCVVDETVASDPLACGVLDERCNDPAFAAAHPELCGSGLVLLLKPATATIIPAATLQYQTFISVRGVESLLSAGVVYTSGVVAVATINSSTGLATAVAGGVTTITASWNGLSANAILTVTDDCGQVDVVVVIDRSKSMSGSDFGGAYTKRLDFAKAAASTFVSTTSLNNSSIGVAQFNTVAASFNLSIDRAALLNYISAIVPSEAFTDLGLGLSTAVSILNASSAQHKVIVLLSDGEEHVPDNPTDTDYIGIATAFKAAGGTIACLGVRATGAGFTALNAIATSGYFLNAYPSNATAALGILGSLRSYFCGACRDESSYVALVPDMTGNNTPSPGSVSSWYTAGVDGGPLQPDAVYPNAYLAFDGTDSAPGYTTYDDGRATAYDFTVPTTVTRWSVRWIYDVDSFPSNHRAGIVSLLGSNDSGSTWTEIDHRAWVDSSSVYDATYTVPGATYKMFAVLFVANDAYTSGIGFSLPLFRIQFYGAGEASCFSAAPGSQNPDPNPLPDLEAGGSDPQSWTLTRSYTACCPPTQVGDCVTRVATYTSLISEADADLHATALARSAAFDALSCCGSYPITIRDLNTADPYPSCVAISNHVGLISTLKVHINGFTHAYPSDVGMVLVGPTGVSVVLMALSGCTLPSACPVSNINIVFAHGATALPCGSTLSSGTFAPNSCGISAVFPPPAPYPQSNNYGTTLSAFANTNPNGIWKLYVIDTKGIDVGTIASWSLEIDDVMATCYGTAIAGGTTLAMVNYATVESQLQCGVCNDAAGGTTAWTGTFPVKVEGPNPLGYQYIATTQSPPLKFAGKYFNSQAVLLSRSYNPCFWLLTVYCTSYPGSAPPVFWAGIKQWAAGSTAVGRYYLVTVDPITGVSVLSTAPAYIDLAAS